MGSSDKNVSLGGGGVGARGEVVRWGGGGVGGGGGGGGWVWGGGWVFGGERGEGVWGMDGGGGGGWGVLGNEGCKSKIGDDLRKPHRRGNHIWGTGKREVSKKDRRSQAGKSYSRRNT